MSELEDKINSILGDPEQMEKIANMAKSLMGGTREESPAAPGGGAGLESLGMDPASLGRLSRILKNSQGEKPQERALLEAMKPYLSEKRRSKMDKAIKLARLAKIARLAMGEMGVDGDD